MTNQNLDAPSGIEQTVCPPSNIARVLVLRRLAPLARLEPREPAFGVDDERLQLWIGILPQRDESLVMRNRLGRVALGLVQFAEPLLGAGEPATIDLLQPGVVRPVDETLIRGDRTRS